MPDILFINKSSPTSNRRIKFPILLTFFFLCWISIGASHHEFWRDEMEAWLVAKDSATFSDLLEETHYQGAPLLWPLLLRTLSLFTPRPEAMQILTSLLAGAAVFTFAYLSPFNLFHKLLFAFSYYIFFEYGIVCRNYLPGIFLLSISCALYGSAARQPWPFALVLAIASLASVHSLIVAASLATSFWGPLFLKTIKLRSTEPYKLTSHIGALVTVGAGIWLSVYSMSPRPDTFYAPASNWNFTWNGDAAAKVSWAFVCSHFPLPRPEGYFWIPSWHTPFPSFDSNTAFTLFFILSAASLYILKNSLAASIFYIVGILGLLLFLYSKYLGFYRHTGFLFFTFLFAIWISRSQSIPLEPKRILWINVIVSIMLLFQAITGVWAFKEDYHKPFSCGKSAAHIILENHLENSFISVYPDWAGAPLAGYLNRKLFYPQQRQYSSFTRWDKKREENLTDKEFLIRTLAESKGIATVLSLDHPLSNDLLDEYHIKQLGFAGGSLTPFEDYYLYYISYNTEP